MITAKFILSLEAAHKVSRTALDSIVCSTGSMMSEMLQKLSMRILSIEGIERFHDNIQGVFSQSNEIECFKDLQMHQCRRTFYKEHFSLIPPEKCLFRSKYIKCWGGIGPNLTKKCGYFIPLLKMLQTLMKLPQFARFIQTDHASGSEIMTDVCDGTYTKSHPLTMQGDIFLQFVISYNDLELQNPLRSNKIHKLAMVYFSLLNIPPQYRSQLNNIFLLGLARTKDVKRFGFD